MPTRALNVVVDADSRGLNRVLDQTESRTRKWGGVMAKGFAAVGAAAGAGLAVGLKKSADAAIEAEKAQATMVAQLRASGISYHAHAKQIDEVIQKHSNLSGLDDEDLQRSFTNIVRVTGDVDKSLRLTGLAADFARAKHMDVAKAGELIGKVAGGNIGILSRYGITLEDGATSAEALAVLQQKFAGQAAAYGKTTAGALDRAGVASENLGEMVGAKLTPILAKGAHALVGLVDASGGLAGPFRTATGAVRRAYDNVAEAVTGFVRRNRRDINDVIQAARTLGRFFRNVFEDVLVPVVKRVVPIIADQLRGIITAIRGLVRIVTGIINGDWSRVWAGVKDIVRGSLRALSAVIRGVGGILRDALIGLAKVMIRGLVAGLKALPGAIKDAIVSGVKSGVSAAAGPVSDAIGFLNPFGDGIGRLAKKVGDGVGIGPGGAAGALGGVTGLRGADADLAPFAAVGARFGLGVSSGIRPGDTTISGNVSYHSSGDAIDLAGPFAGMRRAAAFLYRRFGGVLRELISPWSELGIKDGRPFRYSSAIQAQHSGSNAHVHVAYTGPFGDGIGEATRAARAAGWRGSDLLTAIAIAGPESGYRNAARLVTSQEDSRGMWQINTLAHPWARGLNLGNAFTSAKAAYRVWRGAGGFSPWTAFSSGSYRSWLDEARAAVSGGGGRRSTGGGMAGPRPSNASGVGRQTGPNTAAGMGDLGGGPGQGAGGGGGGGYEVALAKVGVAKARAEARDDNPAMVKALLAERKLKRRRLRKINRALKRRLKRATRVRLLGEKAQLVVEIGEIGDLVREYSGKGITPQEAVEAREAGIDTTGAGGDAGGVAGTGEAVGGAETDPAQEARDRVQEQLLAAIQEKNANDKILIRLTQTQGPQMIAAVVAAVNGSIGGSLGLGGFQAAGVPGQVART